ncbi:MAG: hypothetical protein KDK11_07515 [Maritimibacter sp.]|nr:hypothetical protein [Maritimibacter sp.]
MFEFARRALAATALAQVVLAGALFAGAAGPATADGVNLLVMGEDADPDTIERHNPVFDRVVEAIAGEMRARGFAVYDETAVTMEFYDLDRTRRPDAELISLARSVQVVPIDAVTAFEIHAATVPSAYEGITDLRLRIAGRVIAVADGQSLGGYEVSYRPGELPMLPLDCDRACLIAFVGDQAAPLARDVGAALAAQLDGVVRGEAPPAGGPAAGCAARTFTLAFNGFDPAEIARFEAFLAAFQGYARHRVQAATPGQTDIAYQTCADPERLEQNLRAMFAQTGAEVWLEADADGFAAARIAGPAD